MSAETTKRFDKSIIYIIYCDGIGCNASARGAVNLARLGFQVKELPGGLDKLLGRFFEGQKMIG